MSEPRGSHAETYLNPVYPNSFPDPFVLKFAGEYFAYCTGTGDDGDVFPTLHSHDLVTWTELGGAMTALANSGPYYWAPEVTYDNGKFYLYYSVGNESLMELRVAVSDRPGGGFVDSGKRLTSEDFAIDAHVFVDEDGTRYLFYATDFLEHTHIGTGTVVDRMIDWLTLEGKPRPVTRARYDWQVYDPNRKEKGGVRWHTVEGPAVIKRKGLYYEMFSGGNWQNTTYGVSFAVARSIQDPGEWLQFSDGENVLPILRTIPGSVVGPGHNSIVRGPNNRELYCIYHRWVGGQRVMSIDRMDFAGDRILVIGATNTPQPAPFKPSIMERFCSPQLSRGLVTNGAWRFCDEGAVSDEQGRSEVSLATVPESFMMELTWRCLAPVCGAGKFGIVLGRSDDRTEVVFVPKRNAVIVSNGIAQTVFDLSAEFAWTAPHTVTIDIDFRRLRIGIDNKQFNFDTLLDGPLTWVTIFAEKLTAALSSLDLTDGFEELFERGQDLTSNGWRIYGDAKHRIENGEMILEGENGCILRKGAGRRGLEVAINVRIIAITGKGEFGLMLLNDDQVAFRLAFDCSDVGISVNESQVIKIPDGFDLAEYHQLRIIKKLDRAICYLDDVPVGDFPVAVSATEAAIFADGVRVAIDIIRLTSI